MRCRSAIAFPIRFVGRQFVTIKIQSIIHRQVQAAGNVDFIISKGGTCHISPHSICISPFIAPDPSLKLVLFKHSLFHLPHSLTISVAEFPQKLHVDNRPRCPLPLCHVLVSKWKTTFSTRSKIIIATAVVLKSIIIAVFLGHNICL